MSGADCVGSRNKADSGADCVGSRNGAGSVRWEMRSRTQVQRKSGFNIIKWNKRATKTTPRGKKQAGRQKTGAQSNIRHSHDVRQRISTGLQTQGDYIGRQTRNGTDCVGSLDRSGLWSVVCVFPDPSGLWSGLRGLPERSGLRGLPEQSGLRGLPERSGLRGLPERSGLRGLRGQSWLRGRSWSGLCWLTGQSGMHGLPDRNAWAHGAERALERTPWTHRAERALEQTVSAPGTELALERTALAPGTERALERTAWAPGAERTLGRTLGRTPSWRLSRLNSEPDWCTPPVNPRGANKASGIWRARLGLPKKTPWGRRPP